MSVTVQKVESVIGETGSGGDRTETSYVLGAKIDGVFIPFMTKDAGYIDQLIERGKEAQAAEKASKGDEGDGAAGDSGDSA